ncbi:MAG: glycosyltransferase [Verrucomicrobiaceae bacterium]|nr:glycosyltransferase [Verrucomicrobiaceae bacterium]
MTIASQHYLLCPFGSGGDVFPFIALGKGLLARGHRVTVVSLEVYEKAIRAAGLEFVSVGTAADFERIASDPRVWHPIHGPRTVFKRGADAVRVYFEALTGLIRDPKRVTILAPATVFGARLAREKAGARLLTVHLQPAVFLSVHDTPVFLAAAPWVSRLPIWVKRFLFKLPNPINQFITPALRRECAAEGVPAPRSAYPDWWDSPDGSIALFPSWFAAPQPDWPTLLCQHTFPREDLAEGAVLGPELEAFLEAGDKPIVFTPGTGHRQVRKFFEEALDAVQRLGRRAIFATRQVLDLPPLPSSVLAVEYVPFSLLLPRSAALVYHGGIGTCSQALAAGIPHLVMAMAHDQPDNANRLRRLRVGMGITPRQFKGPRVAECLKHLLESPEVAQHCADCARRMQSDPHLEVLLDWIEKH